MTDCNAITEAYIAAWNETDAAVRKGLVKATFAPGVSYRDPIMQGDGHDGIDAR